LNFICEIENVFSRTNGCEQMATITLLTDFGLEDAYVGIVKGVILTTNPTATIVDITHSISPGDVARAAYLLETSFGYFPPGTVHVVVVDPGVGSERGIVAVDMGGQRFLAPDNGVLTGVLPGGAAGRAVSVENPRYFLPTPSRTFHGRDIFAPVAAQLSMGLDLEMLGPAVDCRALVRLNRPAPALADGRGITGMVVVADRFGNLITNIQGGDLPGICGGAGACELKIQIGSQTIHGLSDTYASVASGAPLALVGSTGRLEISINGGSAVQVFGGGPGIEVRVEAGRPVGK